MSKQLTISLEGRLLDTLRPLHPRLPADLADELAPYLSPSPPAVIPYSLLFSISKWTRSDTGLEALHDQTPSLNPHSYSMVSLLAGTTTSPDRSFGVHTPPPDPAQIEGEKTRERKSITALVNALLSVVGSACAGWWAAKKIGGWRDEWSVLVGLFVAVVVAVSEGVLFLLWQSRVSEAAKRKRRLREAQHKKVDDLIDVDSSRYTKSNVNTNAAELRRRK